MLHLTGFPESSFEMVPHTPVLPSGKPNSCLDLQHLSEFKAKREKGDIPDDVHYLGKRCFGENTYSQGSLSLVGLSFQLLLSILRRNNKFTEKLCGT